MPKKLPSLETVRFISDLIVCDENTPEDVKIDFLLMNARMDITDLISDKICIPLLKNHSATLEQKKAALEYLLLVKAGIESFIQQNHFDA